MMDNVSNYTENEFKKIEGRIKNKAEKTKIRLTFNPISFTGSWISQYINK